MNHKKTMVATILSWTVPFIILIGAFVVSQRISKENRMVQHQNPIPVRVMRPEYGDLVRTLTINGYVESETMVTVLPLVSGILKELTVDVGDRVKRDQIIARIDPERFRLQLSQAEAAYLSAKSTYERMSQLYRDNATSTQNFEQAKAQYDAYQSQYELAKLQLEYTKVKSPMDGTVLQRHLSVGSLAAPERPLLTIADLKNLRIRCQIPERYYGVFLQAQREGGSRLGIRIQRTDGSSYPGVLRSLSPYIQSETKNFEVVVSVVSGVEELRPGMFVTSIFELSRISGVYRLPFSALAGGNSLWYMEDGRAKRSEITITESNDSFFVVAPEWKDRDVIVEGWYFLREGSSVVVHP